MKTTLEKLYITSSTTAKEAMKKLDQTAEKILFVVDESQRLLGSITDGDIRRWILADHALSDPVDLLYNRFPYFFLEFYDLADIKQFMLEKKLECIPILDGNRHIVDLLFWNQVFETEPYKPELAPLSLPIIIMAGGFGTRLEPFTKILPKPLIPIGDKSVLEIIIDQFLGYQIDQFYLSVNHKSRIIKSYFEELDPPYSLTYIHEEKPLGTAGSLRYLRGQIEGPVLLTNCDIIIKANYTDIVEFHKKNNFDITVVASMKHYRIPYGICEIESGGHLIGMTEKPEYTFLVNTGMYIVDSKTFDLIPEGELFHMTHLVDKVKTNGGKVGVFPISEKAWIDTGEWQEYRNAISHFGC